MFGKRSDGNGNFYWATLTEEDIAGIEKMLGSKGSGWGDLLKRCASWSRSPKGTS
ncbi:hypothetical protein ACFLVP_03290 [Chloroflexota bacterium]